MQQVKEINEGRIAPFQNLNLHCFHEPTDSEPEIITHHHNALHPAPVTLAEGLHQFGVLLGAPGMKPLLELVQHEQDFLARWQEPPPPQRRQRLDQR